MMAAREINDEMRVVSRMWGRWDLEKWERRLEIYKTHWRLRSEDVNSPDGRSSWYGLSLVALPDRWQGHAAGKAARCRGHAIGAAKA